MIKLGFSKKISGKNYVPKSKTIIKNILISLSTQCIDFNFALELTSAFEHVEKSLSWKPRASQHLADTNCRGHKKTFISCGALTILAVNSTKQKLLNQAMDSLRLSYFLTQPLLIFSRAE